MTLQVDHFVRVAALADIPLGKCLSVTAGGHTLALFRSGEEAHEDAESYLGSLLVQPETAG